MNAEGRKPAGGGAKARPYCYEYPRPAVTVDLVVFAPEHALVGTGLRVLLVRRKHDPFAGHWAVPGGFVEIDEPIEFAARRELREETGLALEGPVELIGVFGAPGRDPRGRTISLVHGAVVNGTSPAVAGADDAAGAAWRDPRKPGRLAFDHDLILDAALAWLARGVAEGPLGLEMLPVPFAHADVQAMLQAVALPELSARSWIARLRRAGRIAPAASQPGRYCRRSSL